VTNVNTRAWLSGLFAAAVALPASAQQPPVDTAPPIVVYVDVVSVVVNVTDRHSRQVADLGQNDFIVYEDGVRQPIRYFASESNLPLRIGLLLDASNSIRPRFQFEQEAAIDFLHTILRPKKDLAFVVQFDQSVTMVQDFTDDPLDLADAVRNVRAGGTTALFDAIYAASKQLAEGSSSEVRKMLIVLSDGEDNASIVSREEALERARHHEVAIFTVSTNAPSIQYSGESKNFQRTSCQVLGGKGDETLEYLAESTGGRAYCPFNTIDVGRSFERIIEELRSQYTIAYTPTNKNRDGRFRNINIEVRRKGLRAHHRPGYYADPLPEKPAETPGSGPSE
jgi:VWFA-related protein